MLRRSLSTPILLTKFRKQKTEEILPHPDAAADINSDTEIEFNFRKKSRGQGHTLAPASHS